MAEKEYIEREAAEKVIDRFAGYLDDDMIFRIKYAIRKHIPAADVAPVKHGRWIYENFYTHCSVCGKMAIYDKYGQEVESDYCPRCGAKLC